MTSAPGVGSGLNVNSVVEQLTETESHTLDRLAGQLQSASAFLAQQFKVLPTIK
jgi:flagellar capping protein FliD